MPTYAEDGKTVALFLFNHMIVRFGVPHSIVTDHGSHFHNQMTEEFSAKLGSCHENSKLYYPQANGQVEAINKVWKLCFVGWLEIINPTGTTFFSPLYGLIGLRWKQLLVSCHSSLSMDSKLSCLSNVKFHLYNSPSNFSQTLPQRKGDFYT